MDVTSIGPKADATSQHGARLERLLFVQPTSIVRITEHFHIVKDGDSVAKELHLRHYSKYTYKDGREPRLFVGPGEKIVLLTEYGDALFVIGRRQIVLSA